VQILAFSDMSVEDVARDAQLPLLQARLAKLREYSELFRIVDDSPGAGTHLLKALRAAGCVGTTHARHYQVGASRRDLGGYFLRGLFRRAFGEVVMVAFGDRESAVPLLVHADVPLVVQSESAEEAARVMARVSAARVVFPGSLAAWAELILGIARVVEGKASPCWC
jgi:mannosyl-3-phosphoglycerate phosphatase